MPVKRKARTGHMIPPKLYPIILDRVADGYTTSQIKEWLSTEHGQLFNKFTLTYTINVAIEERRKAAAEIYAKVAKEAINNDLYILSDKINTFDAKINQLLEKGDNRMALQFADRLLSFLTLRVRLSGVDKSSKEIISQQETINALIDKLGK
jgi:hypothetical protein